MTSTTARGLLAATLLTAISLSPAPGAAQVRAEPTSAQARIDRLEAELRDLQSVVYSAERPGAPVRQGTEPSGRERPVRRDASEPARAEPSLATRPDDVLRIAELEREMAELTGRIEELSFRLAGQQRQVETILAVLGEADAARAGVGAVPSGAEDTDDADLAADADAGEDEDGAPVDLSGGEAATGRQATAGQSAVSLPDDPDEAYEVAYDALLAGDYARSEAAFEAYLDAFPDGVQAPEAEYLLGEIYLATESYTRAANTFLRHVQSYPDDPRAPEAYLKLGTSFARLDKPEEACRVFRVGRSKFPQMSAGVRARFDAEGRRAECEA